MNPYGKSGLDTIFADVDLSAAKNIELCRHVGNCIIDHRTLMKSGNLPLPFLRGCGLPDSMIEYLPSLLNEPIQFYSCFISYSHKDDEFAKRLHADLQDKGVRCWFAPEELKIGDKPLHRIDESTRVHDKLLLILSEKSIESDWVEHEVTQALKEEERRDKLALFPIRIDDAVMKTEFGWAKSIREAHRPTGRHIGDFSGWKNHHSYQKAFERLMRDLKDESGAVEAAQ